jgi:RNA polymerase sigma-70 factor (ECF subfamily)
VIGQTVGAKERDWVVGEAVRGEGAGQREVALVRYLAASLDHSYALAAVILGDRDEAEEATHDAVCAAWRGLDRLRDPAAVEAWFTRILVNACRDHLRRRRIRPLAVELPDTLSDPEGSGNVAALDELERALDGLSPEHRTVVVLRFWADLSLEEIAERTGERPGTVKSRLHYALAHLRTAYAAEALPGGTPR